MAVCRLSGVHIDSDLDSDMPSGTKEKTWLHHIESARMRIVVGDCTKVLQANIRIAHVASVKALTVRPPLARLAAAASVKALTSTTSELRISHISVFR